MAGTWFTSDTHFNHARVAEMRGFATAEEHDEEIVRRWNRVVKPGDQVWHLGDVAMSNLPKAFDYLNRLNGTLHLVTGNHDEVWPGHRKAHTRQRVWLERFESVQAYARRKLVGEDVLLCHFPYSGDHTETERYSEYRLRDTGKWLLHGHVHDAWKVRARQINVGVDRWELAPVDINTIASIIGGAA